MNLVNILVKKQQNAGNFEFFLKPKLSLLRSNLYFSDGRLLKILKKRLFVQGERPTCAHRAFREDLHSSSKIKVTVCIVRSEHANVFKWLCRLSDVNMSYEIIRRGY